MDKKVIFVRIMVVHFLEFFGPILQSLCILNMSSMLTRAQNWDDQQYGIAQCGNNTSQLLIIIQELMCANWSSDDSPGTSLFFSFHMIHTHYTDSTVQ